jgi:hypothetical protein
MLAAPLPPDRLPISRNHDPFKMPGLDMRSEAGRRFRDLAASVIEDLDPNKVRELAGLRLSVEIATVAAIGGDPKAPNHLVRLSNLAKRAERELREAKRAAPAAAPSSLHDRLAARYAPAAKGGAT